MCVLCGDIAGEVHWAERSPGPASDGVSDETRRRQGRFRRARIVNRVLMPYRVSLRDDLSGTRYLVADAKGAQEVANDMPEVWAAAERLARTRLDPLDESLLAELEAATAAR